MHNVESAVIWFSSVIAGMILTILMPRIVSEPCGRAVTRGKYERIPSYQGVPEWVGAMILIEKEASITSSMFLPAGRE
jgi:hypothetical protein